MKGTKVVYTTKELATLARLDVSTVTEEVRRGNLRATKIGKGRIGYLIARDDAIAWGRAPGILREILPTVMLIGRNEVDADGFQIVTAYSTFEAGMMLWSITPAVIVVSLNVLGLESRVLAASPASIVVSATKSPDSRVLSAWGQRIVIENPGKPDVWFTSASGF